MTVLEFEEYKAELKLARAENQRQEEFEKHRIAVRNLLAQNRKRKPARTLPEPAPEVEEDEPLIVKIPNSLARTSPFFPMSTRALCERNRLENLDEEEKFSRRWCGEDCIIVDNSWGRLSYNGSKLRVLDESVFLSVLSLAEGKGGSLRYNGPLLPVMRNAGIRGTGRRDYKRTIESLKRLCVNEEFFTSPRGKIESPKFSLLRFLNLKEKECEEIL